MLASDSNGKYSTQSAEFESSLTDDVTFLLGDAD